MAKLIKEKINITLFLIVSKVIMTTLLVIFAWFKIKIIQFKKYKTKKETRIILINVVGKKNNPSNKIQLKFKALEEGTFYARDLVSEPGKHSTS